MPQRVKEKDSRAGDDHDVLSWMEWLRELADQLERNAATVDPPNGGRPEWVRVTMRVELLNRICAQLRRIADTRW